MGNYFYLNDKDAYGEYRAVVGGYSLRFYYAGKSDALTYYATAGGWESDRREATFRPCAWARRLHGNAPSGAQYGSYRVILPNGKRASVAVYL